MDNKRADILSESCLTILHVKQWIMDRMVEDHLIFHPDTPFEDYVEIGGEGKQTFTDEQADRLNRELEVLFGFCDEIGVDIYRVCIEVDEEYTRWWNENQAKEAK